LEDFALAKPPANGKLTAFCAPFVHLGPRAAKPILTHQRTPLARHGYSTGPGSPPLAPPHSELCWRLLAY
jgi:hypothetical protein